MKLPTVKIDLGDDYRDILYAAAYAAYKDEIKEEASLTTKQAAEFLNISYDEFYRTHSKKIKVVDLSARCPRYRRKDLIAYRDKHLTQPQH